MGLKIYDQVSPDDPFSVEGAYTNPLSHSFNGVAGEVVQKRYFVRNDDNTLYYTGITVQPIDGGEDIVDDSALNPGYSWKLHEGDEQPLDEEWALVPAGSSISLNSNSSLCKTASAGSPLYSQADTNAKSLSLRFASPF